MAINRWIAVALAAVLGCAPQIESPERVAPESPMPTEIGSRPVFDETPTTTDGLVRPPPATAPTQIIEQRIWLVQVEGVPTALGGDKSSIEADLDAVHHAALDAGIEHRVRYRYRHAFKGLSVELGDPVDAERLWALPGVAAISANTEAWPMQGAPDIANAVGMTGADKARDRGLDGSGVLVGIIDTGIDYDHPDLGGCFGVGCRVEGGTDFVGDDYRNPNSAKVPDDDPDDCHGHGTHVAGIVGANGIIDGVAPAVQLRAYRVFGCSGSTGEDVLVAAIDLAVADGVDVINYSIGSSFSSPNRPSSIAAGNAVAAGVVFAASAGNSQGGGLFVNGGASVSANVISVASVNNTQLAAYTATTSDGRTVPGLHMRPSPRPTPGLSGVLMRTGTATSTDDACAPLDADSLAGGVALIRRGGCFFATKANHASRAGAVAVLIYNQGEGFFSGSATGTTAPTISIFGTSDEEGEALDAALTSTTSSSTITLTWSGEIGGVPNPGGGLISGFSSYGPSFHLEVKPDVSAPGGSIFSTYPLEKEGYAVLGGTSMSSPHTAGAAALLLQLDPTLTPDDVKARLQNYARPLESPSGRGVEGELDHVWVQGAGLIDIDGSVVAPILIRPGDLPLGDDSGSGNPQTLTFTNTTTNTITLTATHAAALASFGDLGTNTATVAAADVTFTSTVIEVAAMGLATVGVTIDAPGELAAGDLFGGYVGFFGVGEQPLVVPYTGYVGDYPAQPVIRSTDDLPRLVHPPAAVAVDPGEVFDLEGDNRPRILYALDYSPDAVQIFARTSSTGPPILAFEDVVAATIGRAYTWYTWGGTVDDGAAGRVEVFDDDYSLILSVLKPLGDPDDPESWEQWQSPVFNIDRPNRAPELFVPLSIEGEEGVAIDFGIVARDLNRDALTYNVIDLPRGASVHPSAGRIGWTPDFDQAGTYPITVMVSDGPETISATTAIVIADVNRKPLLAPIGSLQTTEGSTVAFTAAATDPDRDPLSFSLDPIPAGATFSSTTGAFSWTPTFSQSGLHELALSVSDGALSDDRTVRIEVIDVNRPPTIDAIADVTTTEGSTVTVTVSADDIDGDPLTLSMLSGPAGATFIGGTFTWRADYNAAGSHTVAMSANDGQVTVIARFTIDVSNVNRAPELIELPELTGTEGQALRFTATARDPDGDPLMITAISVLPSGATFNAGAFDWRPGFDDAGRHQVVLQASDGDLTDEATVVINITDAPRAPTIDPIAQQTVAEGQPLTFMATGADPDGDPTHFTLIAGPLGAAVTRAGAFSWTPGFNDAGPHRAVIEISDGAQAALTTVAITVTNTNRAPTVSMIPAQSVLAGDTVGFVILGVDPDGDALTYSATNPPAGANLGAMDGRFTWTPSRTDEGNVTVEVVASDGDLSASTMVSIEVRSTNRAPVIEAVTDPTVAETGELSVTVMATDPDGDQLTFSAPVLPVGALFDVAGATILWTPGFTDAGAHPAAVSVSDGTTTVTVAFTIFVTDTNRPPTLEAIADVSVEAGLPLVLAAVGADPDGGTLTFAVTGLPDSASFDAALGLLRWTPAKSEAGDHAVTVSVTDGTATATAAFTVTVTVPPDPPKPPTGPTSPTGPTGPTGGNGDDDEGCSCTSSHQRSSGAWALALPFALALLRRRRR